MPIITVEVPEKSFSESQKREMIERITDAIVAVQGESLREFTFIRIDERSSDRLGLGGKPLDAMELHMIAARSAGSGSMSGDGDGKSRDASARCILPVRGLDK